MLLKELTNICGVSGDEGLVREFLKEKIEPYADEITVDTMGNLIALKKGSEEKRIMLSAHMDEVGFIISGINEKGYLEFKTVGGIDARVVLSKKLLIGKNKVPGVIGIKAIHLQEKSERENVPKFKDLYIDIGAANREEAEKYVSIGDYACFDTEFAMFSDDTVKAKAIDDRAGCAILAELIKKPVKYDTYFCFTVQEEVGLRGAQVAAYRIEPDVCMVIEGTTANDVYDCPKHKNVTAIGGGAAISFMDGRHIAPRELFKWLQSATRDAKIPVQLKNAVAGGNDAGRIHLSRRGVKTISVSVPTRYLHSPAAVASLKDIEAVKKVGELFLDRIDEVI